MGTVADVNYGFKGQVSSAQTPLVLGTGARYAVIGSGLKAEAGGAGDRSVTVSAGTAWGDGVLSTWNTSGVVNAAANSTGQTRWDTLVIRRHWQPASSPTGTATLMLLTGGAAKTIAVSRKTDRGVTDSDQPIALVPIANGSAVAGTPVGLRCWDGSGGGLVAESVEALQYLSDVGTQVRVGNVLYSRMLNASGFPVWEEFTYAAPTAGTIAYNTGYGPSSSEPSYPPQIGYTLADGVVTVSGMVFRTGNTFNQPGNADFWVTGPLPAEIRRSTRAVLGVVPTYSGGAVQAELIYDRDAHRLAVRFRSGSNTQVTKDTWWVSLEGARWRV